MWKDLMIAGLWIGGGLGWVAAFEVRYDRTFSLIGKAFLITIWPVIVIAGLVEQVAAEVTAVLRAGAGPGDGRDG